jgi:dTDP-4-dehydrorhamnose 3,5-epimerase
LKIHTTALPGVLLIEPVVRADQRGFFLEAWHEARYREAGIDLPFVQDNHSRSVRGVLRGLHYQLQQPQGKLIRVVTGDVFDVAVDLRRSAKTFGQWLGVVLSGVNQRQLWVPPGFAHGFYTLTDSADVVYKCTDFYAPQYDRTLRWDDPNIGIKWPLVDRHPPRLTPKDAAGLGLSEAPTYD